MPRLLSRRFLVPSHRLFSTSITRPAFSKGPSPPRLPAKEQEEFERLQKSSTGAFSTPRPSVVTNPTSASEASSPPSSRSRPQINQSPALASETAQKSPQLNQSPTSALSAEDVELAAVNARVQATGKGEELHPDVRRGAKPEFEGDVNPVTGEVGGPKNEPLRWGSTANSGDWSYNGRVTDF